jgi:hypothetical protein
LIFQLFGLKIAGKNDQIIRDEWGWQHWIAVTAGNRRAHQSEHV